MPKLKQICMYFALSSLLGLTACATVEKTDTQAPAENSAMERFLAQQQDDIAGGELPDNALSPELLLRILKGDIAAQRADEGKSVPEWLSIAGETQDARAAKHATLVAINAKNFIAAQEAASLWVKLAPESNSARQIMIGVLLQNKKIPESIPHIQMLLHNKPGESASFFAQLHLLWGQQFNLADATMATETLTKDYMDLPEAKFALAYIRQINGRHDEAMQLLDAALKQKPDLVVAQNLHKAIADNPTLGVAQPVQSSVPYAEALVRARGFVALKRFDLAQALYSQILQADPQNIEAQYNYGLLLWQQDELEAAMKWLKAVEARNPTGVDVVRLQLGYIAEQANKRKEAQNWYRRVQGPDALEAKRALMISLARDQQLPAALKIWAGMPHSTEAENIQRYQQLAQLYVVHKDLNKAASALTDGLKKYPESADLYYDRAMIYTRQNKIPQTIADLREALKLAPDNAMILNGLGFVLVDNNLDLAEAEKHIKAAKALEPESVYIQDSWGWLLYRQGKLKEAESVLRDVANNYKNAEVLAHLGEVLWMQNKHMEAKEVFTDGLKWFPNDADLLKTMRRLGVK